MNKDTAGTRINKSFLTSTVPTNWNKAGVCFISCSVRIVFKKNTINTMTDVLPHCTVYNVLWPYGGGAVSCVNVCVCLAHLEGDFEEMESRLMYLETLCCQCEQQTFKQHHINQLEVYKKKKRYEIKQIFYSLVFNTAEYSMCYSHIQDTIYLQHLQLLLKLTYSKWRCWGYSMVWSCVVLWGIQGQCRVKFLSARCGQPGVGTGTSLSSPDTVQAEK